MFSQAGTKEDFVKLLDFGQPDQPAIVPLGQFAFLSLSEVDHLSLWFGNTCLASSENRLYF